MKLPIDDVSLIKLLDRVLTALGIPEQYIVKIKQEREAYRKWNESDQQFIDALSFASPGGVKAPNGSAIDRPGTYYYKHKPTGEIVYVGHSGSLYDRTGTGKTVAKSIIETGKPPPQTIYIAVEKMMTKDRNLENWTISYVETFSSNIAKEEEERIILEEDPRFNDPKMAGK